jgi:hypothetical protein
MPLHSGFAAASTGRHRRHAGIGAVNSAVLRRLIQGIRKGSESFVPQRSACYAMIIRRITKTVLHGPWPWPALLSQAVAINCPYT